MKQFSGIKSLCMAVVLPTESFYCGKPHLSHGKIIPSYLMIGDWFLVFCLFYRNVMITNIDL